MVAVSDAVAVEEADAVGDGVAVHDAVNDDVGDRLAELVTDAVDVDVLDGGYVAIVNVCTALALRTWEPKSAPLMFNSCTVAPERRASCVPAAGK